MEYLNNSKVIAGVAMLMLNVGSKHVHLSLSKSIDKILANEYAKKCIVFSMFFVATRDISIAFLLTILYIIIVDGILNESKQFCILPKSIKEDSITDAQYKKAQEVVKDYNIQKESTSKQQSGPDLYENYINTLKT